MKEKGYFGASMPNVLAFKWGRAGWGVNTQTYPNTEPLGALPIATPGPYALTAFAPDACSLNGGAGETVKANIDATEAAELVRCVGNVMMQGPLGGTWWVTGVSPTYPWLAASDPLYRPIDVRDSVPAGEYIYDHSGGAYSLSIPLNQMMDPDAGGVGNYGNLKKLDTAFTGGGQFYYFYGRTQVSSTFAAAAARMLGYTAKAQFWGIRLWNNTTGEAIPAANTYPLLKSQAGGSMYAGTISHLHVTNTGLNTAPIISGLGATSSYTGGGTANATIAWTTDYPATTQVDNKATYNDTVLNTSHSASLTGLSCGTSYTVNAISYDCSVNQASSPITFTTADCQDLYVSSASAPGSASVGSIITVGATVNKSGTGSAAASTARVYLYGNLNGTGNKFLKLGDVAVSGFGAGSGSVAVSAPGLTIPSWVVPGSDSIVVVSDINNTVSEWNESNNRRTIPITIVP